MLTREEFEAARMQALELMKQTSAKLEELQCPERIVHTTPFNLKNLTKQNTAKLLEAVPSKAQEGVDYVYVLRAPSDASERVRLLADHFARERKTCRGFSRLIEPRPQDSHTLYVGRSKKLRERLRQHLGGINQNSTSPTYALWLETWSKCQDLEVTISYMRFENVDHLLVQAVEDGLWSSLKPVFGRRGDK